MAGAASASEEPPKATRKAKVKRQRAGMTPAEEMLQERHHAEVLRLLPPYTLHQAEDNYRALIKLDHPDANDGSEVSTLRTAKLNEAVEYFRRKKEFH